MFKDEIRAVFPYIFMLFTEVCGKLPIIFDRDKVSCIVLYGNVSKPTSLYKLANRCGRAEKTSRFFRPLADGCFEGRFFVLLRPSKVAPFTSISIGTVEAFAREEEIHGSFMKCYGKYSSTHLYYIDIYIAYKMVSI